MRRILSETESGGNVFEVSIDFKDISINSSDIIGLLGYENMQPPEYIDGLVCSAAASLENLIQIRAGYAVEDSRLLGIKGIPGAEVFTLPETISAGLKNSEKVILFTVTIGPAMEDLSRDLIRNGDPVLAYIYDLIASAAAEACADALHEHIRAKMKSENMKVTNRYSPGYCLWNVEQQKILFSYLPDNFCGISLTDSFLMMPVKSVSGIIGAGMNVSYTQYSCGKCELTGCIFRRVKPAAEKKL